MRRVSLVVVVTSLTVASVPKAVAQQAVPELQGVWRGVRAETKGVKGPLRGDWDFRNGVLAIPLPSGKRVKWKYSIDPKRSPKAIDLIPDTGPAAGKTLKGIYRLEKDTLTVCHIRPNVAEPEKKARPSSFGTTDQDDVVILTFERKKQ